jgi:hypothetical protein
VTCRPATRRGRPAWRVGALVEGAAEVGDLHVDHLVAVHHRQQVGRLHVAVDHALAVDVAQRHRALEADLDDLVQRQQRIGAAEAPQRHAVHVLHHQVGRGVVEHRVQDLHHVRVVQPADQGRFGGEEAALEVRFARVGHQPHADALDRHVDAAELVAGQEDLAGGPFAQAGHDRVLADLHRQFGRAVGRGRDFREADIAGAGTTGTPGAADGARPGAAKAAKSRALTVQSRSRGRWPGAADPTRRIAR